jgi:hypothetical protein
MAKFFSNLWCNRNGDDPREGLDNLVITEVQKNKYLTILVHFLLYVGSYYGKYGDII